MDKTYESFYEQGMGKAANEGFEPDIAKVYADNYAKELHLCKINININNKRFWKVAYSYATFFFFSAVYRR